MDSLTKAIQLMENNQSEEALQLLDKFLVTASDDEKYSVAELYLQWGLLEDAQAIILELLESYPMENDLKIMLAEIYTEMEQDEKAIEILNEIGKDDNAYVAALVQLADLYQAQGLHEVAQQKLLNAKQIAPNEVIIDFALGELNFSIGEFNQATTYYELVIREMEYVSTISLNDRLAESYARIGEYEKALEYFEKSSNENTDFLFQFGLTAHQAGRNDIAIHVLEKVIKEDAYYHSAYYHLATVYEEEERIQEAFESAIKGFDVDEFNKELYFYAGKLAHKLGNNNQSEEYIRKAIALDSEYKEAVLFLIEFFKEQNKTDDIIELLNEMKRMDAYDPDYEWELARAYNEMEEYDYALKHYREAYNSLQHDEEFLKEYGYFLVEEGRTEQAIHILESYITHQPFDEEILEYLSRLKTL